MSLLCTWLVCVSGSSLSCLWVGRQHRAGNTGRDHDTVTAPAPQRCCSPSKFWALSRGQHLGLAVRIITVAVRIISVLCSCRQISILSWCCARPSCWNEPLWSPVRGCCLPCRLAQRGACSAWEENEQVLKQMRSTGFQEDKNSHDFPQHKAVEDLCSVVDYQKSPKSFV